MHAQWHWLLHLTGSGNGTVKNIRYIDEEDIRSFKVSLFMNLRTNRVAKHLSVPVGSVLLALCCWLLHLTSTPIFMYLRTNRVAKHLSVPVGSVLLALCCWLLHPTSTPIFINLSTNRVAKPLSVPVGSVLLALCL